MSVNVVIEKSKNKDNLYIDSDGWQAREKVLQNM